jgi:1,4-alpha-glucan branching enzyme
MARVTLEHVHSGTAMGANLVADGATFRVWGGTAREVHVIGSFIDWSPTAATKLVPTAGGHWWGFVEGAKDRDRYKYFVVGEAGGGHKRDPYARELDWEAGDCVIRREDFPWHDIGFVTPRYEDFILYQLHVGVYSTPHWPPRSGTFLDVADKMPYLVDLGISAIQLLPVQEFPSTFSLGYNGVDYYSPESEFAVRDGDLVPYVARLNALLSARGLAPYRHDDLRGESNQLKALVDLAHIHGIAVILDVVYNHAGGGFGNESIYFFDRQDGQNDHPPRFEKSLYFTHREHAGGRVFDFAKPEVRAFLIDNAKFLLSEYRVDGLRYDQTSVVDHDGAPHGWSFLQDLSSTVRSVHPGALQNAEYWNVNPSVVKPAREGGAGFDTTLTDGLRVAIRRVIRGASVPGEHPLPMTQLAESMWPSGFATPWSFVQGPENHDLVLRDPDPSKPREERIARLADPSNPRSWYARSRSRVAAGICLTAPGIPMLFMGQEFLEDKQWSDDLEHRPELRIHWDGLEDADPSMRDFLRFTRELIRLRWQRPALRSEGFRVTHVHDEDRVLVTHRWIDGVGEDVMVVVSLANHPRHGYRVGFPTGGRWAECFNSDVYDRWVNADVVGNGGEVFADDTPLHDFAHSATLVLPANAILVFARS